VYGILLGWGQALTGEMVEELGSRCLVDWLSRSVGCLVIHASGGSLVYM
jgi:hypothetical protein